MNFLKSPWRGLRDTDYESRMLRRVFLYRMMVFAPVTLILGVAVESRTYSDGFLPVMLSPVQMERMNAYIPLVQRTNVVLRDKASQDRPEALRLVAGDWVKAIDEGKLKDLPPIAFDDSTIDGLKASIFECKTMFARRLSRFGLRSAKAQDSESAAADMILALRLSEAGKFSDLHSVLSSAAQQRLCLKTIDELLPKLSKPTLETVRRTICDLQADQRPVSGLETLAKRQYLDWIRRQQKTPLAIEDIGKSPAFGTTASASLVAGADDSVPPFVSVAGEADQLQAKLVEQMSQTTAHLEKANR